MPPLSSEELRLILAALSKTCACKSPIGYHPEPKISRLQAKLSIALEVAAANGR